MFEDEETRKNKGPRGFAAKNRNNSILHNSAPRKLVLNIDQKLTITFRKRHEDISQVEMFNLNL